MQAQTGFGKQGMEGQVSKISKLSAAAFVAFAAMSATAIPASAQPKKCEGALTYQSCGKYLVHVQEQRYQTFLTNIPGDTSPAYMKYSDPRYNSTLGDAGGGGGGGGGGG